MNGIPPGVAEAAAARASGAAAAPAAGGSSSGSGGGSAAGGPLQCLRNHPQFDALRRLVQSNPQTLQAVLTKIGQQDPQLLQEINENQAVFLEMMNEPIAEGGSAGSGAGGAGAGASAGGAGAGAAGAGGMEAMLGGMSNPAQMAQMLQAMGPEERAQMAAMMGLTSEQLDATAQAIASMPPEQFQQYMQMAGGGGGMGGMMGGGGGGGGGGMAIQLTQEEMAAIDRLASMGFDRAEAAQAYLACDKNEELAANLLMDGGFGFADDGGAGGGGGGGAPPGGNGDGDDMYD